MLLSQKKLFNVKHVKIGETLMGYKTYFCHILKFSKNETPSSAVALSKKL